MKFIVALLAMLISTAVLAEPRQMMATSVMTCFDDTAEYEAAFPDAELLVESQSVQGGYLVLIYGVAGQFLHVVLVMPGGPTCVSENAELL